MEPITFLSFLSLLVYLRAGWQVLLQNKQAQLNRLFALVCFFLAIWAFVYGYINMLTGKQAVYQWIAGSSVVWNLYVSIYVHFNVELSRKQLRFPSSRYYKGILAVIYLPSLIFAALVLFNPSIFFADMVRKPQFWIEVPNIHNVWFNLYYAYILLSVLAVLVIHWIRLKKTGLKREKYQSITIMTGIGISLFINMLVMFIIPVYVNMDLPIATPVSNLVWLGFTWLAIERYHFFKLDSEEQSFRKVISKMQEFLFFMDKYATIERTNSYTAKLLQVNEEELCGCKLLDFIENNKEILEIITAQEAFYYAVNYEVEFKTKNGSRIPARISFLSITDRFNDIMGYVVIGHDTRNEIHLKQEILHKNNIQKDLVEAKEKAEESEKLKTSFLLNTSHEIRTPMNSIIGYANLLREEIGLTPAKDEYLRYIEINSKHLLRLIDDILDISKIETNSLKISMSECNLNGLLDEVYNNMISERNLMDKEHIRLQLSKPLRDEESHIRMDYFRLKQVLINLVQNALKFTHEGEVRFGHMKPANEKIEFFVTDTGIGIPPQEQPLIFERFKQLENPASAKYEGSGLGLAITKSIIELLGGEIHVDSAVDQGSKFTFALPYLPVQSGFPSQKQKKERIAYNWTGKTIVIVEDNKMNAYLMKKNIEKTRANIVLLYNGVEVIEYFEKGHVADMVLMDLQLPEMNGHDAARAIRTMNPNIPIIAQTANVFVDRKTLQNDGFVELITKPIDFKSMLLAMNRYLINVVKNS